MDDLILARSVANVLWANFSPAIRSGNQIYFCFSRELIQSLLGETLGANTLDKFFELAASFYFVSGGACELDEAVFTKDADGVSLSILVIAQQILVVEDMVNEGGITEEAYFPRLRRRISSELKEVSSLPIPTQQFTALWNVFRQEVVAAGAHELSITFISGLGNNKYRSFPMSQALLSTQDLFKLFRKLPAGINLRMLRDDSIVELAKKYRFHISSRGRRVLSVNWLRPRLVNQLRNFALNAKETFDEIERKSRELDDINFRIFSSDDLFDSKYEVRGVSSDGEMVENIALVRSALTNRLGHSAVQIFALTEGSRDYWTISREVRQIQMGETLIILGKQRQQILSILGVYWTIQTDSIEEIDVDFDCAAFAFKVPHTIRRVCSLRDGQLIERNLNGEGEWLGGICVDARNNSFLVGFTPINFSIDGKVINHSESVYVGGRVLSLGHFLEEVSRLPQEHGFRVSISARSFSLNLVQSRFKSGGRKTYGFKFEDDFFSPVPEEVASTDVFLSGLAFNGASFEARHLARNDIFQILEMNTTGWIEITPSEIAIFEMSLSASRLPSSVKRIAKRVLRETKLCPPALKIRLQRIA